MNHKKLWSGKLQTDLQTNISFKKTKLIIEEEN